MAGRISLGSGFLPKRITEVGELSNPVIRSFIASFDVALIEAETEKLNCSPVSAFLFSSILLI